MKKSVQFSMDSRLLLKIENMAEASSGRLRIVMLEEGKRAWKRFIQIW